MTIKSKVLEDKLSKESLDERTIIKKVIRQLYGVDNWKHKVYKEDIKCIKLAIKLTRKECDQFLQLANESNKKLLEEIKNIREECKNKEMIFINHIEEHLDLSCQVVVCKICGKSVEQIYQEQGRGLLSLKERIQKDQREKDEKEFKEIILKTDREKVKSKIINNLKRKLLDNQFNHFANDKTIETLQDLLKSLDTEKEAT